MALPIKYRDLLAATLNQTCAFQLLCSIRDGWPLGARHFGEELLRNLQCVLVTAVNGRDLTTERRLEILCAPVLAIQAQ